MDPPRKPKPDPNRFRWLWLLILAGGMLLMARFIFVATQSHAIGLGEEMMADDFGFMVIGVEHLMNIPSQDSTIKPEGQFLVVELQVANHAKRVDFRFDPQIVFIEDEFGERYHLAELAQKSIDPAGSQMNTLAAGETGRRRIVFDVPSNLTAPRIRIAFGGRVGETLDYLLYGSRWFEIPEKTIPNPKPNST